MERTKNYQIFIRSVSIVIGLISILAIFGWLLNIEVLTNIYQGLPTMKFNTALSFLLLACVIFCIQKKYFKFSATFNVLLLGIALVTLLQDIIGFNLGIDQFFIEDKKGILNNNPAPGRMSMATSVSFILLSISLFLIQSGKDSAKKWASYCSLTVVLLSFLAFISFLYRIPTFEKITFISSMAIHTASGFILAGLAISLIIPNFGITELFISKRTGSFMMRKMFFQLLIITLLISYSILYCFRKGYLAADFSIALVAAILIFTTLILLVLVSHQINSIEKEKRAVQEELQVVQMYLNTTPDPLIVLNKVGGIELANSLMLDFLGYSEEELKERKLISLIPERFHQEHEEHLKKYLELVGSQIDDDLKVKRTYHDFSVIEVYALKKNGEEVPVEMTLNSTRSPKGIITITAFRDISRRVEAENKLQVALEASIVGIWDYDIANNQLNWDETMFKLYGRNTDTKQNPYEFWRNNVHPEDIDGIENLLQESIAGTSTYDTDFRITWPDDSIHYVRAKGKVYRDENHNPVRMLGTNWDVTKQKKLEISLLDAKQRAESASKFKSEFLANMSHEIRTPLNGIIGFTDLLTNTPLSQSQREYLKNVNNSANLLLDVINDILDFSKIEAGKLELHLEKIDIYELCEQTIDVIRHQAEQKGLEVLLHISADIQRFVYADPLRLRQVLTNLLSNAIKFTPKGEIELQLKSSPSSRTAGKFCFEFKVRDTGIGIAPEKLKKIFGAFDQEDSSTTRKYGGTGLGLTISNRLLGLMDSRLQLKSQLGLGSEFYFYLQFDIPEGVSSEDNISPRNIKKVLVVDDNESNRYILEEMLKEMQIKVVLASNSIETLEILERDKEFDLVIMDYNMPYMSGIELIEHIRRTMQLTSDILPILLLHSAADDNIIFRATEDFDINITHVKPIHFQKLKELLEELGSPFIDHTEKELVENTLNSVTSSSVHDFSGNGEKVTIMVAEDNPVNQFLAKEILRKVIPEAKLVIANDGNEAVEKYQTAAPNLIFMDIQMPEMSGLEATLRIRELEEISKKEPVPIIALTARVLKTEQESFKKHGMDNYLSKPIIIDDIKKMIATYLFKENI